MTRACLTEDVAAEVIVVDDAGEPEVEAVVGELARRRPGVELRLIAKGHAGRSVARNRGAQAARGSRVLFLDGDVLVTPGTLRAHARLAAADARGLARGGILRMPWLAAFDDPATGSLTAEAARRFVTGPRPLLATRTVELAADGYPSAATVRLARANQFERDIQAWLAASRVGRWIGSTGAHLSIDREALIAIGGFDERMGLRWGAEDLELGFRVEAAALSIAHLPDAVVVHMDHETHGRDGDHAAALAYFAHKHGRPAVLRLLDYFDGRCALAEVARA
jgi:GT2 family glycosyltransferase